jgi:hypothetical protein
MYTLARQEAFLRFRDARRKATGHPLVLQRLTLRAIAL